MKYGLFFERFLNPERVSMPDIDMDFGDTRRGEVVEYVRRKYGDDHVAQIVTFGTMAARGVIRDVGRALNMSYADCDVIAKLVPAGPHVTLDDALRISRELREKYEGDEQVKKLIDTARALEGMPRHASTHAAGVVITKRPVVDYVPLARNDDTIVCQYVMTTLEELGLLKMDFLGLRNLTILDDAVKTIREKDKNFTLAVIPENDAAAYEMLGKRETADELLISALAAAEPDALYLPFVENYRYLKTALTRGAGAKFAAFVRTVTPLGEDFVRRCGEKRAESSRPAALAGLTERESAIAALVAKRLSNREIAEQLFLSEGSVKQYINQIYSKLLITGDVRTKRKRLAELAAPKS